MQTNFISLEVKAIEPNNQIAISYNCSNEDKFSVVISRYHEDIEWIKTEIPTDICVTIYNKGEDNLNSLAPNCKEIKLPNFGHESQTYLYHIINNYDNLPERILFLQGHPFDHHILKSFSSYLFSSNKNGCKNIYAKCDPNQSLKYHSNNLKHTNWAKTKWSYITIKEETMQDFAYKVFHVDISKMVAGIVWGANFAVDRENILCHSKNFHQNILDSYTSIHPLEDHYMERLWDLWADCSLS